MVIGHWLMVIGHWLMVIGHWLMDGVLRDRVDDDQVVRLFHDAGTGHKDDVISGYQMGVPASPPTDFIDEGRCVIEMFGSDRLDAPQQVHSS